MSVNPEVIYVGVEDCEVGSEHGPCDGSLTDVVAWFQEQLEKVPEEYRETAQCEIEGFEKYDTGYAHIRIWYTRLETSEEANARVAWAESRVAIRQTMELAKLRELAAKYPEELK